MAKKITIDLLNLMLQREFKKVNSRFGEVNLKFDKANARLNEEIRELRNNIVQFKDDILKEIVDLRDDITVTTGYRDMIEDHEQRIGRLEKTVSQN